MEHRAGLQGSTGNADQLRCGWTLASRVGEGVEFFDAGWELGFVGGGPAHEADEESEGVELVGEGEVGLLVAHAQFAEGVIGTGLGGGGLDDGDEVVDEFVTLAGHGSGGLAVQPGDAGFDGRMLTDAIGALRRGAQVTCGGVGFHDAHAAEAKLGEAFLARREGFVGGFRGGGGIGG